MKRLTEYTRFHGSMLPVMNNSNRYSALERLAVIEDILGDDYDLDHLRALVQADRDGRCIYAPAQIGDIVAPVVYGEWLCAETDDEQFFLCSVCNDKEYWESNYCPNCGAKMYEEQEEPTNGK